MRQQTLIVVEFRVVNIQPLKTGLIKTLPDRIVRRPTSVPISVHVCRMVANRQLLNGNCRIGGNPPGTLILVDEYIGDLASSQKRSSRLDVSIINRRQDSME